ncbi:MAG: gamma-glutamylcyclotransferase, partial [Chitinophagaceae bacterium]
YFNLFGPAKVKGRLYDTGEYPAAAPVHDEAFIIGELYLIKNENEFSWAIGQLDGYEGIDAEEGEAPLYRREITDVFINDAIVPAWIYWYSGDLNEKPVIESGDILEYLRNKQH